MRPIPPSSECYGLVEPAMPAGWENAMPKSKWNGPGGCAFKPLSDSMPARSLLTARAAKDVLPHGRLHFKCSNLNILSFTNSYTHLSNQSQLLNHISLSSTVLNMVLVYDFFDLSADSAEDAIFNWYHRYPLTL